MDFKEIKLYNNKSMADMFKEIHKNSQDRELELKQLIGDLKPLISTAGDAMVVVPLISKYIESSIKNDDNLIKMVGIVQRAINSGNKNESGDVQLSDEEKEQLLANVNQLKIAK